MIWLYGVIHKVSLFSLFKLHRVIITILAANVKFFLHSISFFFLGAWYDYCRGNIVGFGEREKKIRALAVVERQTQHLPI